MRNPPGRATDTSPASAAGDAGASQAIATNAAKPDSAAPIALMRCSPRRVKSLISLCRGNVKGMASFPLMVFDLDGTLVDALPDLTAALNRLLAARGLEPLTPEQIRPMIGDGTKKLVERAL